MAWKDVFMEIDGMKPDTYRRVEVTGWRSYLFLNSTDYEIVYENIAVYTTSMPEASVKAIVDAMNSAYQLGGYDIVTKLASEGCLNEK